jgi:outer membrane protein assembly factor BamA
MYSQSNRLQILIRRAGLFFFALAFVALFCSTAWAQQATRLERIEFVGLKKLTSDQVIALSGLTIGQQVNQEIFDAAAAKLLQTGLFRRLSYRVHGTKDRSTITFEVQESAVNLPVVFENFVWFTDDEIAAAIKREIPVYNGTAPANGDTADKIVDILQRLLSSRNINGRVEYLPSVSKEKQELLYTVKGARVTVCSLHFPGASAVSEAELVNASRELLNTEYSRKDTATFAPIKLMPLYRRIGHLRAEFQTPTVVLENSSRCAGGVAVTIPVEEGRAYRWLKSVWDGNDKLSVEELATALGMNPGDLADGLKIDSGLKNVAKAYSRKGYLSATVNESIEYDDNSSTVTYRFNVSEGLRYFMGNLIVNGLTPADVEQLKAKWTLGNNAVFDESYVEEFRKAGLREFITGLVQRSRGARVRVEVETRPNAQNQTVDVLFNFK